MRVEIRVKARVRRMLQYPARSREWAASITRIFLLPVVLSVALVVGLVWGMPGGVPVPSDSNVSAYSTKVVSKVGWPDGRYVSFRDPQALALDSKGRLFVADVGSREVYVLDKNYRLEAIIGNTSNATIRTPGMNLPGDVAFDSAGRLYVCDWQVDAVHIFDPNLSYLGSVPLPNGFASCIAVDSKDRLIVGHYRLGGRSGLLVFTANESDPTHGSMILQNSFQICPPGEDCTGLYGSPDDITVDSQGRIIVAEGPTMEQVDLNRRTVRVVVLDEEFRWLMSFGSFGDWPGALVGIHSVAVDPSGVFVVADGANRISFFFPNGTYAGRVGASGSDPGKFSGLGGLLVVGPGRILVPEYFNDRIQEVLVDIPSLRPISISEFGALAIIALCAGVAYARNDRAERPILCA